MKESIEMRHVKKFTGQDGRLEGIQEARQTGTVEWRECDKAQLISIRDVSFHSAS